MRSVCSRPSSALALCVTLATLFASCAKTGPKSQAPRTPPVAASAPEPAPQSGTDPASGVAPAVLPDAVEATKQLQVVAVPGANVVVTPIASRFDDVPVALLNPAVAVASDSDADYEVYLVVPASTIDPARVALLVIDEPDSPFERKLLIRAENLTLTSLADELVKISAPLRFRRAIVAVVLLGPDATVADYLDFVLDAATPSVLPVPGVEPAAPPRPGAPPLPPASGSPSDPNVPAPPASPATGACAGVVARACPAPNFTGDAGDYSGSTCTISASTADYSGAKLRCVNWTITAVKAMKNVDASDGVFRDAALENADLDGADFTGADLAGADLGGAKARGIKLVGAKLAGAALSADLSGAKLANATGLVAATSFSSEATKLTDADLHGTGITAEQLATNQIAAVGALFDCVSGPDVRAIPVDPEHWPPEGANAHAVSVQSQTFTGKKLVCVDMGEVVYENFLVFNAPNFERTSFADGTLNYVSFFGARFTSVNFADVSLNSSVFDSNFVGANVDFRGAELTNAKLGMSFRGVDFSNSSLSQASLTGIEVTHGSFVDANLTQLQIDLSIISGGNPTETPLTCTHCDFTRANLTYVDFRQSVFVDTDFRDANLNATDFGGATLTNCSFAGAVVDGTKFSGTGWTRAALEAAGAIVISGTFD